MHVFARRRQLRDVTTRKRKEIWIISLFSPRPDSIPLRYRIWPGLSGQIPYLKKTRYRIWPMRYRIWPVSYTIWPVRYTILTENPDSIPLCWPDSIPPILRYKIWPRFSGQILYHQKTRYRIWPMRYRIWPIFSVRIVYLTI